MSSFTFLFIHDDDVIYYQGGTISYWTYIMTVSKG